jgi:trans-aconitate methyltransferase
MDSVLTTAKRFIDMGNLDGLKDYYECLFEEYESDEVDVAYLFRQIYVHACLRKQRPIVDWLKTLYEAMDPIMKIGLRQIFGYGDALLRKP